ncbi:5-(carboxyamino)imidazole ribonucleotide synthase [Celerinatantimonas diazotrophica]|uniref:N5-carboxyaminoimidazole ribonucleotide synthase n=1 Tax=Celerinatantimonas diazotrophica TaxID=412034 RepID=A0A4R1J8D6_9GAMM|nr:5-(carboxyamino)imidazole ribonucleotide synthase [Celerinatantimonas diazotrophica]TCK46306.1 5-(carboxyamino)imidazole ribonucleotide synthase [Celerinatantimonas diazotrophica]CAG9295320.1 N5-carboxyaminoimidazole ribonucleotide synthase [Celerinatantimonas diazotrophica]
MQILVLGAGQLARMMALDGLPLNLELRAFDVGPGKVVHPLSGDSYEQSLSQAIDWADVITSEFEHIPYDVLETCEKSGKMYPDARAIKAGGDRCQEKQLLDEANVANAPHVIITDRASFEQALSKLATPMVLKSARAGYDGKGQWRLKSMEDAQALWQELAAFLEANPHQAIVGEKMIPFDREVSLVGARTHDGSIKVYPLAVNHHYQGVLNLSIVDGKQSEALEAQAQQIFEAIANTLNYVGVLAIELFVVGEKLLVNEIAPRVHNSGHWSQQGAFVSQFDNHLRAVANLPLGDTQLRTPTAMINILGQDEVAPDIYSMPGTRVHWYGKSKRPGRKMGHINVTAQDAAQLIEQLNVTAKWLPREQYPGLHEYLENS